MRHMCRLGTISILFALSIPHLGLKYFMEVMFRLLCIKFPLVHKSSLIGTPNILLNSWNAIVAFVGLHWKTIKNNLTFKVSPVALFKPYSNLFNIYIYILGSKRPIWDSRGVYEKGIWRFHKTGFQKVNLWKHSKQQVGQSESNGWSQLATMPSRKYWSYQLKGLITC